jgi:Berberine and berberine like
LHVSGGPAEPAFVPVPRLFRTARRRRPRTGRDLGLYAMWNEPSDTEANVEWAQQGLSALEPYLENAVYSNNLGDEGGDRVRTAYGQNYGRLAHVKAKYDPDNVFRLNQHIEPAS